MLYVCSTEAKYDFNELKAFETESEIAEGQEGVPIKLALLAFSNSFLPCITNFSKKIDGDYFLNSRNSHLQKMLRLNLYFGNTEAIVEIINFVMKESAAKRKKQNLCILTIFSY